MHIPGVFRKWLLRMLRTITKRAKFSTDEAADESGQVSRKAVIKDVYAEVGLSVAYFSTLMIANLIALGGLITNSAAVIIGAMLISPLMSPIFGLGFAFVAADNFILFRSAEKIILSVLLVIAAAAFATWVSPLKDVTAEITARARPNLYDLVIAFLAGTAGAAALCSRKNYLTIVPGVAIATAVIPPLSVVGFGIGTGDFSIAFGGFFLFFVNLVAIIISTFLVLYAYGFRPLRGEDLSQPRRRIAILLATLFVISIPLFYTLNKTVSELRLHSSIGNALSHEFNKKRMSSLQTFGYNEDRSGKLLVTALVNTVSYIKQACIDEIEQGMRNSLKRDLNLYVEQVKVQPGGLKEAHKVEPPAPVLAPVRPPRDILKTARENTLSLMRNAVAKLGDVLVPSRIEDFRVTFQGQSPTISVFLKVRRDTRFSGEETRWLENLLSKETGAPLQLRVETEPWVQPLLFARRQTTLSPDMRSALGGLKDVFAGDHSMHVLIEAFPESMRNRRERKRLSEQRIKAITEVLTSQVGLPPDQVTAVIRKGASATPSVRITVHVKG